MTGMRRGWFHLASGAGVGRIFGFVSNLLLSRWLGPTDLGLFNLVVTTVQTSDTLARCGGDYALNFELGGQPETMQTERGMQLARAFVQLCSLTTALICVSVFIWVWWGQGLFPIALGASQRLTLSVLLLCMIVCEGISASAWEVLLVSHRTAPLSLRHGLFFPLRLLSAAVGALLGGVFGALGGWTFVVVAQCIWLRIVVGSLWNPLQIWPILGSSLYLLLKRGLPFYASNLLSSMIFYPLLLNVAASSGLAEIGYLRAGQVLQQVFAFLPATLVPVLFLKLRAESTFKGQVVLTERPLRLIWLILLEFLVLYYLFDRLFLGFLFGSVFGGALLPTRLLLLTALFECLTQLVAQPFLATGQTRIYGLWQNAAAVLAAVGGFIWIPANGLSAYLTVRLMYTVIPLLGLGSSVFKNLDSKSQTMPLIVTTLWMSIVCIGQLFGYIQSDHIKILLVILAMIVPTFCAQDLKWLYNKLRA